MAMSDLLNKLLALPADHPLATQLFSLLPAISGAVLQARNGGNTRIGAPLGAGLGILGQYGIEKGFLGEQQAQEKKQNQSMADLLSQNLPLSALLQRGATAGLDPDKLIADYQAINPQEKSAAPVLMQMPDGTMQYVTPHEGLTLPAGELPWQKGGSTGEPKTEFQLWRQGHPSGTAEEYGKFVTANRKAPKSPAEIAADQRARVIGTFSALETLPVTRWNPGVVVLANDKTLKLLPAATRADIESGKGLPVLKSDIKQLRQAQTAKLTLNDLNQTIEGALPKEPGILSASGMLGRKITSVIKPEKLARFNAARLGAADAFIRAITQRGNKAQFDEAMKAIVGPNATVSSAKAGIAQASAIVDDLTNTLVGRAGDSISGAETNLGSLPAIAAPSAGSEPPPPEGFE